MPTLDWIGKDKVINHHIDVHYRVLNRVYSYDLNGRHSEDNGSENKIIHGDNLEALKSLLPEYAGRIKCIYIDPPYNTGNEGWVYNDNVNDPRIKKWLGEVVGKEGEDLSRHDKWLCMMYPRLRLLHKLLANDGAIFISIDDNELYNLKMVCDEIFGSNCFVADISWQRTYSTRNDSKGIVSEVEHILVYSAQPGWNPKKLPRTLEMNSKYGNPDNDIAMWRPDNAYAAEAATHQGMVYGIQHPFTGKLLYPANGLHWRQKQSDMLDIMRGWCNYELRELDDAKERAIVCGVSVDKVRTGVKAIVLSESLEVSAAKAREVYLRGPWPKYYFTKEGYGGIAKKTYLDITKGVPPSNFWPFSEAGHTDEAKKGMLAIFNGKATFDTPKPYRLVERILQIAADENSIILDSFAGSGTTAHAVLNMNKADGGSRKFILIEMEDYADSITSERVKRVIHGYGEGKSAVEGTGGNFCFYELGKQLMLENGTLNPDMDIQNIRNYIWYTETKKSLPDIEPDDNKYFLAVDGDVAYYFCYEKDTVTTLDRTFLRTIRTKAESYIIYADQCAISDKELQKYNITFKKIPRDIASL